MLQSSPHIKEDFEKYVANAIKLIHSEQTRLKVLGMLHGKDPVSKVADATVMIIQRLDTAARHSGTEVQDTIKVFAAHEIVNLVVEFGEAAGIFRLNDDLKLLALSSACQKYVQSEIAAGRIDGQALQVQLQADMKKMPQKERADIEAGMAKVQNIAKRYNGGQGVSNGGN